MPSRLLRTALLLIPLAVPAMVGCASSRDHEAVPTPPAGRPAPEAGTPAPASATLTLDAVPTVRSEAPLVLRARLALPSITRAAASGTTLVFQARLLGTQPWITLGDAATDVTGTATLDTRLWKTSDVRVGAPAAAGGIGWTQVRVTTSPAGRPVIPPAGAPEPASPPLDRPPPIGAGANARVTPIPDRVWTGMQGTSWRPGCVPRQRLRYLTVNYWGFDGYRYRGELVLAASVAADAAAILGDLYAQRYPIRQMALPDAFGANPHGVGADDYAQMAADNTSGFNCRYVVGREAQHVLSLHALGRAIDINTWENPYVAPTGRYPDTWYLDHRDTASPAVLLAGDPAVRAFTRRGWTWGGTWTEKDWQHFQR